MESDVKYENCTSRKPVAKRVYFPDTISGNIDAVNGHQLHLCHPKNKKIYVNEGDYVKRAASREMDDYGLQQARQSPAAQDYQS